MVKATTEWTEGLKITVEVSDGLCMDDIEGELVTEQLKDTFKGLGYTEESVEKLFK